MAFLFLAGAESRAAMVFGVRYSNTQEPILTSLSGVDQRVVGDLGNKGRFGIYAGQQNGNSIFLIGVSHKTAPVEVRERLAFAESKLPDALQQLEDQQTFSEGVIVSTCNRVEVYVAAEGDAPARHFFTSRTPDARDHLYVKAGVDAIRHLFARITVKRARCG